MTVKKEIPHILRLTYRQQPDDPDYGSCLWAFFDFDIDKYTLSIQSDCGEYGHRWPASSGETFMELCARMDDSYFETKMFGAPITVNGESTVKQIMDVLVADRNLDEEWLFEPNELDAIDALKDKECELDGASPDGAGWILDEWANEYSLSFDELWEYVDTEYSGNQKKISEVFKEHIQPAIRSMLGANTDDIDGALVHFSDGKIKEKNSGAIIDLTKIDVEHIAENHSSVEIPVDFFNTDNIGIVFSAMCLIDAVNRLGLRGYLEGIIKSCAPQK